MTLLDLLKEWYIGEIEDWVLEEKGRSLESATWETVMSSGSSEVVQIIEELGEKEEYKDYSLSKLRELAVDIRDSRKKREQ